MLTKIHSHKIQNQSDIIYRTPHNKKIMKRKLTLLLATLMMAMPMMAGDIDGDTPGDTARVYDIDEIVVVSQPKEHTILRQQPVSSTILSSNELEGLSLRDLKEISDYVPAFVMPNYGSRFTSSI